MVFCKTRRSQGRPGIIPNQRPFLEQCQLFGNRNVASASFLQVVRCIFVKYMGILTNLLSFPYFYQKNANPRILNQIVDRFSQDSPAQWKRRMCAPVVCRRNWRMQSHLPSAIAFAVFIEWIKTLHCFSDS